MFTRRALVQDDDLILHCSSHMSDGISQAMFLAGWVEQIRDVLFGHRDSPGKGPYKYKTKPPLDGIVIVKKVNEFHENP